MNINQLYISNGEWAIFAIGSGACNIIKEISQNKKIRKNASIYLCDCEPGCGNNHLKGKQKAEELLSQHGITEVESLKRVIILSTLGGGAGTGAAPVFCKHFTSLGICVYNIVTLPFDFEGKNTKEKALLSLNEMNSYGVQTIIINEEMYQHPYRNNTLPEFFSTMNHCIKEAILCCYKCRETKLPWYRRILQIFLKFFWGCTLKLRKHSISLPL